MNILLCSIIDKNEFDVVDALLLAVIGIAIVFIVLIALMLVITLVGKILDGSEKAKQKHPEWGQKVADIKAKLMFWKKPQDADAEASEPAGEAAVGSCGELKLINTTERDAAMIMAIVANEMGEDLNKLHFKCIKQIENDSEGEKK